MPRGANSTKVCVDCGLVMVKVGPNRKRCGPCRDRHKEALPPNVIRTLRPGESTPDSEPRRYVNGEGYVRLRWKVGYRQWVECYEHRFLAGLPANQQVHHRNRKRADNSKPNLVALTTAEHGREHRQIDDDEVIRLYRSGLSTVTIGRRLGYNPASIWRALERSNEPTRSELRIGGRHAAS